jgi:NADH:ubiquinone oxidoreductase subunit 6 (subunit J)
MSLLVNFFKLFLVVGLLLTVWNLIFTRLLMPKIFWLILLFVELAFLLLLHGIEFLSFVLLLLYVGAVSVLFLFVVMILNPDSKQNLEKLAAATKNTGELTFMNYSFSIIIIVFMFSLLCAEAYTFEFYNYLTGVWVQAWPFLLKDGVLHSSGLLSPSLSFATYESFISDLDTTVDFMRWVNYSMTISPACDVELEELKEALIAIDLEQAVLPGYALNFYTSSEHLFDWDVAEFREAWYNTQDLYAAGDINAVDYTKTYFSLTTLANLHAFYLCDTLHQPVLPAPYTLEQHTLLDANIISIGAGGFGSVPFASVSANSDLWAIAESFYTQEFVSLWIVGLILLSSMIGTILLTLQKSRGIKHQKITNQSKRYHAFKH